MAGGEAGDAEAEAHLQRCGHCSGKCRGSVMQQNLL
jgi:hypothetical protein